MVQLGKLEKVDLRKIWEHEAKDFSSWLAEDANLALLSEELGIDIEVIGTEASSGRFRVDILAKEANTGEYIIIENQLESTNHDHLGKVITYAAGYNAKYIIWVVKDVLPEHHKAIEWLNEHLDDSISCFLVKIEVWQIGDSNPAPRFEVVSIKNDWFSSLKQSASSANLSTNELKQQEFWTQLRDNFKTRDSNIRIQSPRAQHWLNFSMGSTLCHTYLTINSKDNSIGCGLWTYNKEFFSFLQERENQIKGEITTDFFFWEANKSAGVRAILNVGDVYDQSQFSASFDWLYRNNKLFQSVFFKYVKEFKVQ